jgi:hypothetical protein
MKQMAACLMIAAGIGGAGYCADKLLVPQVTSCCDGNGDVSDLSTASIPDWHLKKLRFRKPCFGLCPEMENWP